MKRHSVAVIGAALFLVVPANVESVAWVSERKTLLATFFGLASMILWLRDRRHLALACFAAGLLAKTSIIVLPGLLVLLDLQQGKGFRWRAYAAFTLPAIALAPVQLIAVSDLGPTPLHGGTAWTHVGTCLAALPTYIANAVTPFGHLPKHPFEPVTSFADLRLWLGILTWSAVGYGMWRSFRGERRFLAAGGFALAAIYLTIIVPIPIIVADRYLYLALPLLLGVCVAWFLDSSIGARRAARYLAVVWVASIMVGTFSYAGAWNNSISLWTYALERRPTDREAWISLAAAHGENQDMVAAAKVLELTVQRFPDFGNAVVNLASLEVHLGRSADAIRRLESLLAKDRQYPQAWCALAVVYTTQNQPEAAARVFREGSDLCPGYLPLAKNHVQFRLTRGEWAEARTIAERFHTANPDDKAGRAALDRMIRAVAPR